MKTVFVVLLLAVLFVGCGPNDDHEKDPDFWRGVVPLVMLAVGVLMCKKLNINQTRNRYTPTA